MVSTPHALQPTTHNALCECCAALCWVDVRAAPACRCFPRLATQVEYDLYGVVNHLGILGAGHYVAYCISPTTGRYVGDSLPVPQGHADCWALERCRP